MTLKLKAYKCIFPSLLDYDGEDPFYYSELIYGKNQKTAVKERCTNDESFTFWEMKKAIRTQRAKEYDLFIQEKHKSLIDLCDTKINHLTHSLGVQKGDVCPDNFYRNYSLYSSKHKKCEELVSLGLMDNWQKNDKEIYSVTKKGIEAVKTLLLTTKSQE